MTGARATGASGSVAVSDHQHIYVVGDVGSDADPQCFVCRERKSASEIDTANAQALAEHTARAVQIMRDEIARIEREAEEDDRFHFAEWKDGA